MWSTKEAAPGPADAVQQKPLLLATQKSAVLYLSLSVSLSLSLCSLLSLSGELLLQCVMGNSKGEDDENPLSLKHHGAILADEMGLGKSLQVCDPQCDRSCGLWSSIYL